jgi:2-desacetyl-2-hydroxyethyl bacteriochlorophyllide A dehydrogenase
MTERFVLPEKNLYRAEGLTLDQAAMVEFLAIGAHAVRRAQLRPGERALVVGAGPIGIGTALFARLAGAEVTLMERVHAILDLAARITGIERRVLADEGAPDRLSRLTGGELFDAVFDATGNAAAMEASFAFAASGGTYILVGVVKDRISFSDSEFHRRELTLHASRNATRQDFDTVVSAMRAGNIPTGALNTHVCDLDEVPKSLPRWLHDRVGVVKAMVRVDERRAA